MISGLNEDLSLTSFPQNISLAATSPRKLTLSPLNSMASVMPRSKHMQLSFIYIWQTWMEGRIQLSLVTFKTKVAPNKRLTIPSLQLCGAYLIVQLLHVQQVFNLLLTQIYDWTDSAIVLSWLIENSRRFNTYVSNRVSYIVELIAPNRWNHVHGTDNLADCASRGLFPEEYQ